MHFGLDKKGYFKSSFSNKIETSSLFPLLVNFFVFQERNLFEIEHDILDQLKTGFLEVE